MTGHAVPDVVGLHRATWSRGAPRFRRDSGPPIDVFPVDASTFVLRQSRSVHYEAPFMYLLLGSRRAFLLDTGATSDRRMFPLRDVVDGLIDGAPRAQGRSDYGLVVAHTHAHADHVAGDGQFADRARTAIVGHGVHDVTEFFGFDSPGPEGAVATVDLGTRVLEVVAIPGHEPSSIAVFDPQTHVLLTGDTVYPGRIYVPDFPAFLDSLDRLEEFARAREVSAILGGHVEHKARGWSDYPRGATYQPREAPLPMGLDHLADLRQRAHEVRAEPGAHRFKDFSIFNGPCDKEMRRQELRRRFGALRSFW